MIEEQATVIRIQGQQAEVQVERQNACHHCELNKGCGTGAVGRMLGYRSKPLLVESNFDLKPGDRVTLGMSDSSFLTASLLIYGLPLLLLIVGSIIAYWMSGGSDLIVLVGAVSGFMLGLWVSSGLAKKPLFRGLYPLILTINSEPTNHS